DGEINNVRAIAFDKDGSMLIGGNFHKVGNESAKATIVNHLARLRGTTWTDVGGGLSEHVSVWVAGHMGAHSLLVDDNGDLFVGGAFSNAGSAATLNIARYDGQQFHTLIPSGTRAEGVAGIVYAIAMDAQDRPVIGGDFKLAGGATASDVAAL